MFKTKIYLGPQEIAGYYANLVQGIGHLGIQIDYFPFIRPKNQYERKKMPFLLILSQRIESLGQSSFGKFETILTKPFVSLLRFIWAIHAVFYYDVFGSGRSFFIRNLDMYLIRFLGKRIISNLAHGSEVRAGQPVEVTKRNVNELVDAYGEKALMLDHRSDLLSVFLEFASVKAKSIK